MRSQNEVRSTAHLSFIIMHLSLSRRRIVGLSALMGLCVSYSAKAYLSATAWPACVHLSSISGPIYGPYRYHP